MFDKYIFSKRLKELRNRDNIMAKDLAVIIGVSKQAINLLENATNYPHCTTLVAIADYFDVSLDYLVGRSDDPHRR